jgi:FtsH-binding integral membrane protein
MSSLGGRGGIFISYRREDAAPYARSLQLQLSQRIPDAPIFIDLDSIEPGLDFAEVIEDALNSSAVMVALIGQHWATLTDESGARRLDNPGDYVRFEIKTALRRGVRVIPVLIDGAKPPRQQDLPADLHKLARLNALELSYDRYQYDSGRLLGLIQQRLAMVSEPAPADAQGREEAERQRREEAERQRREEAERQRREEAERQRREEAERRAPIPVVGPIVLIIPLLLLAMKLLNPSIHPSKAWWAVALCAAALGCVAAAVERGRSKIPIWTTALEFVFVWLALYAMYRLNIGHIQRISRHQPLPLLTILAGVGAIFIGALLVRALARSAKDRRPGGERTVHPLLPVFLGCMTAGFGAAAIGYAGQRYETLANIGPTFSTIGGVFILAALLVILLAPLLELVRRRQGHLRAASLDKAQPSVPRHPGVR